MSGEECDLETLAARVREGDRAAAAELRRRLVPQLVWLLRRALRQGGGGPPLAHGLCEEVCRALDRGAGEAPDAERLIGRLARQLCRSILEGLEPSPAGETVRDSYCVLGSR